MNKKIFFVLFLLVFAFGVNQAFCAVNSKGFIGKLSSCTKYIENGDSRINAVLGWSSRKCHYVEKTYNETITCAFKQKDLKNVAKIMSKQDFNPQEGIMTLEGADKYFEGAMPSCESNLKPSSNSRRR